MSGGIGLTVPATTREHILRTGLGYTGENYPWYAATGGTAMIDGSFYYMLTPFKAGDLITNIHVRVNIAGATLTLAKAGIYSTDGQTLLASTESLTTSWQSAGGKTHALSSPYTVTSDQCLYIGVVSKGSTLPALVRQSLIGFYTYKVGSVHPWGVITGQTDLPATFTPNGDTGSPIAYWVGWS